MWQRLRLFFMVWTANWILGQNICNERDFRGIFYSLLLISQSHTHNSNTKLFIHFLFYFINLISFHSFLCNTSVINFRLNKYLIELFIYSLIAFVCKQSYVCVCMYILIWIKRKKVIFNILLTSSILYSWLLFVCNCWKEEKINKYKIYFMYIREKFHLHSFTIFSVLPFY